MKKTLLICLWILIADAVHAQKVPTWLCDKKINWGIKIGTSTDLPVIKLEGNNELWTETTNKMNFHIDALARINFKYLFIQPETGYSNTNEVLHIVSDGGSANPSKTTIETSIKSSNFSLLLGYYSIKENEYALNIFSGCMLKYAYYLYTDYPEQEDISGRNMLYNVYVSAGLGVNISNLFFDFRYDIALRNKDVIVPQNLLAAYGDFSISKRANILGFSIGVMF
jgi:hypothetical protein